jgi:aminoglycoside/choline kinase family phosphotransferase
MQDALQQVYEGLNKWKPGSSFQLETLAQAGSNRQYFRIKLPEDSYILTLNPGNIPENNAFMEFTRHFSSLGLPVPYLVLEDEARRYYVQSDLGDKSLFDHIREEGF